VRVSYEGFTHNSYQPILCTKLESRAFDYYYEHATVVEDMKKYLLDWDSNVVLVGVTVDEPAYNIGPACSELNSMGVSVDDISFRGAFSFVLQRGYPAKTVFRKALDWDQCKNGQARLSAVVAGINIDLLHSTHTVGGPTDLKRGLECM